MQTTAIVSPQLWIVFGVFVVGMLARDWGVFNRKAHEIRCREAARWTTGWGSLAVSLSARAR